MNSPILSVGEVAQYLGVSVKFVYKHQDEICGKFKLGGRLFFNRETLIEATKGRKPARVINEGGIPDPHNIT